MDAPPTTPDIDLAALDSLRGKYIRTDRDDLFRLHLDRLLKRDADDRLLPEPVTFTATGGNPRHRARGRGRRGQDLAGAPWAEHPSGPAERGL